MPAGWTEIPFDDRGWRPAGSRVSIGLPPWHELEPSGIPLQREQAQTFARVVSVLTGRCAEGYASVDNLGLLHFREQRKAARQPETLVRDVEALLRPGEAAAVIRPIRGGEFTALLLDAGRETAGYIRLDLSARGGEIVDLLYSEHIDDDGQIVLLDPLTHSQVSMADRYRCRAGRQQHEFFWWKGFRYALVVFRDVRQPVRVHHVGVNFTSYPVEEKGHFACSDPVLNEIWKMGRYTLQLCMHDSYMDCPWREQAQWLGDARVQWQVNAYTFGDHALMRRMLRQGAQSQTPQGLIYGVFPSRHHSCILPDFGLQWAAALWEYYWYSGDDTVFAETYGALQRLLGYFAASSKPGVLPGAAPAGLWLFLDWSPIYKDDLSATYAMQYLEALRGVRIARHLRQPKDVRAWQARARAVERAIVETFWDPKRRAFCEGYDRQRGKRIDQVGQHANALAVQLDLQPEHNGSIVEKVLWRIARQHDRLAGSELLNEYSARTKSPVASPYFYAFVLGAMFKEGYDRQAIETIRRLWGRMLQQGYTTFYESWDQPRGRGHTSACHAWSASPTALLSAYVGGIRPMAPGFAEVMVDPRANGLEHAEVAVPTPHGTIRCQWREDEPGTLQGGSTCLQPSRPRCLRQPAP